MKTRWHRVNSSRHKFKIGELVKRKGLKNNPICGYITGCKAYYDNDYRYEIEKNIDPNKAMRILKNEYRAAEIQRVTKQELLEYCITGELNLNDL